LKIIELALNSISSENNLNKESAIKCIKILSKVEGDTYFSKEQSLKIIQSMIRTLSLYRTVPIGEPDTNIIKLALDTLGNLFKSIFPFSPAQESGFITLLMTLFDIYKDSIIVIYFMRLLDVIIPKLTNPSLIYENNFLYKIQELLSNADCNIRYTSLILLSSIFYSNIDVPIVESSKIIEVLLAIIFYSSDKVEIDLSLKVLSILSAEENLRQQIYKNNGVKCLFKIWNNDNPIKENIITILFLISYDGLGRTLIVQEDVYSHLISLLQDKTTALVQSCIILLTINFFEDEDFFDTFIQHNTINYLMKLLDSPEVKVVASVLKAFFSIAKSNPSLIKQQDPHLQILKKLLKHPDEKIKIVTGKLISNLSVL